MRILDVIFYGLLVLAADQLSKYIIRANMEPHESLPIIKGIFHITYVQNTGAAFSILQGKTYFFTIVSLAIILAIIFFLRKVPPEKRLLRFVMALVLGGAAGNLIDRFRFGYVVDFFDFRIWPVFNIADSAIVVGVIILAYLIAFDPGFSGQYGKSGR
ncbi:signal peptidase II [Biomaibacter acetigenes]|uniref:signal peptidase II n=1 Tax=Biomaibacter acetigenes TaxID=2316383 RepID=UPI00319DC832